MPRRKPTPHHLPSISVVVPSYNHGQFLRDNLESILSQEYPNVEIQVMDGGSKDETVDILKGYGSKIGWVSEKDGGQTDAISRGFQKSSGEIITWLNSDDIMCNRSLWHVAEAAQDPEGEVFYGEAHYMDKDGGSPRPYPTVRITPNYTAEQAFFEKGYVAQPSVYYRKTAYERVGGVNLDKNICMDYDLWVRFARGGCRWTHIPVDMSGNRWWEHTKSSSMQLDLLAEVIGTQIQYFGQVSSYFVQALSDHLYGKIHSRNFGDGEHLLVRSLYFKAVWSVLNYRSPKRVMEGLLFRNIASSGPIVADYIPQEQFTDLLRAHLEAAGR